MFRRALIFLSLTLFAALSSGERLRAQDSFSELDGLTRNGIVYAGTYRWERSIRVVKTSRSDTLALLLGLNNDLNGNVNLLYLVVQPEDYDTFCRLIKEVGDKFAEWSGLAAERGIRDFRKQIPVDFGTMVHVLAMMNAEMNPILFRAVFESDAEGRPSVTFQAEDGRYSEPLFGFRDTADFTRFRRSISADTLQARYAVYLRLKEEKERVEGLFE